MLEVLPWIQTDDETATNNGGVVYQETPSNVDSLPPQMRARRRQRIGIGIVCIHFSFCDSRVLSRSGEKPTLLWSKAKHFKKTFSGSINRSVRLIQVVKRIIPPCALSCFCHISYLNSLNRRGTLRANLKPIHSGIRFSLAFCFCDRKKAA